MSKNKNRNEARNSLIEMLSLDNNDGGVTQLSVNTLHPYKGHPFAQYKGRRLEDMVESIREFGILEPIIVRPVKDGYEILSGHNRVNAAGLAGLEYIPAVIMEGLNEDEARLIVTETNLRQRSFSDLSYREKGTALYMHMEAARAEGKLNNMLKEIESCGGAGSVSKTPKEKFRARDETGKEYGLEPRKVSKYIAIGKLPDTFLDDLDTHMISEEAAYKLSNMSAAGLKAVESFYVKYKESHTFTLQIRQAEMLKNLDSAKNGAITEEEIRGVLESKKEKIDKNNDFAISTKIINKYFGRDTKKKEIEKIIQAALEEYFLKEKNGK